jgi:glycosyltransferase involved in cell wall biosynthesis
MARYMQDAHVLLHPRLGDWCPNVVVEAMACGLPVVCGSWGGTAELVGEAGRVVAVGPWAYGEPFVEGLVLAVEQVLDSLESSAEAARGRAEAMFDITSCAGRYLEALGLVP